MKIAIVVHGPNIIDSGYAIKIINFFEEYGDVQSKLGGTMGRTAVIDASLEKTIDISSKLLPSESLEFFNNENVDLMFLINYGKSSTTGHVFGYKVFNHYNSHIKNKTIPLIQIERPGEEDGSLIYWNEDLTISKSKINALLDDVIHKFDLTNISPNEIEIKYFKNNKNNKNERKIHGVSPNENILVNGVVVGKSNNDEIVLITENSYLTEIKGGTIKNHGVQKLGKFNLEKAIVKTGLLRKSDIVPRTLENNNNSDFFKVVYLNHAAENIYEYKDVDLVLTIGDDTTLLASDILYRFNVPVIGITDGDLDKLVEKGFKTNDSIIFKVQEGYDDIVGEEIFKEIFKGENFIEFPISCIDFEDFKTNKINEIKCNIIKIINNRNYKYIIE